MRVTEWCLHQETTVARLASVICFCLFLSLKHFKTGQTDHVDTKTEFRTGHKNRTTQLNNTNHTLRGVELSIKQLNNLF